MTDLVWGVNGRSLFDPYSIQHVVWFFALTVALASLGVRRVWVWAIAVAAAWETFEYFVAGTGFPFAGHENLLNKLVGDTLSDIVGVLFAIQAARALRRRGRCGNT